VLPGDFCVRRVRAPGEKLQIPFRKAPNKLMRARERGHFATYNYKIREELFNGTKIVRFRRKINEEFKFKRSDFYPI
jgi:hypothetical protein